MPKIYTKMGDDGETNLLYGSKVSKNDPRCEAYGATDEVVSALGLARALCDDETVKEILLNLQHEMFIVGAELATDKSKYQYLENNLSTVTDDMVFGIERRIDEINGSIQLPNAFIIPGASKGSGAVDLARSQLRTAERRIVSLKQQGLLVNPVVLKYVNRVSDLLFVLARYEDRELPLEVLTGASRKTGRVS